MNERCMYCNSSLSTGDAFNICYACRQKQYNFFESLQAQLNDARNELCLKCGNYHKAHNGACDGCRWKEIDIIRSGIECEESCDCLRHLDIFDDIELDDVDVLGIDCPEEAEE